MKQTIKITVLFVCIFLAGINMSQAGYPEEPINMIIPFSPGGGSDRLARILDNFSKDQFGHNFVFIYKPGAGGAIGTADIAKAPKDGYWLGPVNIPQMVTAIKSRAGSFKIDSFEYICQIAAEPMVLVTPKQSKIKTLKQFIQQCKKEPGKTTVGLPGGMHASPWLSTMKLREKAGIQYANIPFKGGAGLNAALLGNHVDAGMGIFGVVLKEKDKLNFLALTGNARHTFAPDIPTFKELGLDIVDSIRRLYVVPKGTSPEKLKILRKGFKAIFDNPKYQEQMKKAKFITDWKNGEEIGPALSTFFDEYSKVYDKYKKK